MTDDFKFQHPQPQSNSPAQGQVFTYDVTDKQQQEQIDQLRQEFNLYKNQRINLNTDIIGLFQSVTVAPTQIPTNLYQQVQIALISGTTYLYIYDPTQQAGGSASNGWFRVTLV